MLHTQQCPNLGTQQPLGTCQPTQPHTSSISSTLPALFFFFTAHKHMNIITALDTLTVHHPIITQHWQISQHYHKVV